MCHGSEHEWTSHYYMDHDNKVEAMNSSLEYDYNLKWPRMNMDK